MSWRNSLNNYDISGVLYNESLYSPFFLYLLKLTCKGCNDGVAVFVVVVFINDERINEFGVAVVVVLLFDE